MEGVKLRGILASGLLALSPILTASYCGQDSASSVGNEPLVSGFKWDAALAQSDLAELTKTPHPFGSARQDAVIRWLDSRLAKSGLTVSRGEFHAVVPNPAALNTSGPVATTLERQGINLYAGNGSEPTCVVALATHTDTKEVAGFDYLGANDSGSSTAVLLQLLAYLKRTGADQQQPCAIVGWFFDGEEAVLPHWNDGQQRHPANLADHAYGSQALAEQLVPCVFGGKPAQCLPKPKAQPGPAVVAVVLLDMVGSPDLQLSRDSLSTPYLLNLAVAAAAGLHHEGLFVSHSDAIEDDHGPFRARGVPTLDLIDFNHLNFWHAPGDDARTLSAESMTLAGQVALAVAHAVATKPQMN